jgi:hypothetical protein
MENSQGFFCVICLSDFSFLIYFFSIERDDMAGVQFVAIF